MTNHSQSQEEQGEEPSKHQETGVPCTREKEGQEAPTVWSEREAV